ncbi:MAG TPA: Rne/Rng family ribonuclease [Sporichthyaceae bacterium]|jgi:ribonuclease E
MLDDEPTSTTEESTAPSTRRRRAAGRPAGPPTDAAGSKKAPAGEAPAAEPVPADEPAPAPARRTRKKAAAATTKVDEAPAAADDAGAAPAPRARRTRKRVAEPEDAAATEDGAVTAGAPPTALVFQAPTMEATPSRRRRAAGRAAGEPNVDPAEGDAPVADATPEESAAKSAAAPAAARRPRRRSGAGTPPAEPEAESAVEKVEDAEDGDEDTEDGEDGEEGASAARRRRRRRGGRGRRGRSGRPDEESGEAAEADTAAEAADEAEAETEDEDADGAGSRRRRRRRRRGEDGAAGSDDPEQTVTRVRASRDEVTSVRGSTRLEAKKQRRREGREAGRRRVPILSEAEFLARREAVDRVLVVRQGSDRTQIAVLEDGVLVEHYVNRASSSSLMGDVYLGRVQNVLPSMEAAFVDIGKGRNAVLYAGEVNFEGLEGQPKRIEHALKSGQSVLVQVTKDPIGHKGARLTSQISLPGRYLVYVPEGSMTGISRKLPDTERNRLKNILRQVVPEDAGVIVRTAAEGASEAELQADVERLAAQWEQISSRAKSASAPALLLGEPDLIVRVVRDVFNEDFTSLIVAGDAAFTEISDYLNTVAPDLAGRLTKWAENSDVFAAHRIDEQILKALDRKVWLPSGGSLVIDRTEAMTVVDVNTGKFTGSGGNLEETVTRNNLEAAEEIVRQLRLRDIGGIIVVDFIDMVLESNRELVLRRLVECLGRDRTKHQVAEVTSLGLVQMTRKRVGQGLLEAFSTTCEHCNGRGIMVRTDDPDARQRPKPVPRPPRNGHKPDEEAGQAPAEEETPGSGRSRSARRRRGRAAGEAAETAEVEAVVVHPREDADDKTTEAAEDKDTAAPAPARRSRRRASAPAQEVPV